MVHSILFPPFQDDQFYQLGSQGGGDVEVNFSDLHMDM